MHFRRAFCNFRGNPLRELVNHIKRCKRNAAAQKCGLCGCVNADIKPDNKRSAATDRELEVAFGKRADSLRNNLKRHLFCLLLFYFMFHCFHTTARVRFYNDGNCYSVFRCCTRLLKRSFAARRFRKYHHLFFRISFHGEGGKSRPNTRNRIPTSNADRVTCARPPYLLSASSSNKSYGRYCVFCNDRHAFTKRAVYDKERCRDTRSLSALRFYDKTGCRFFRVVRDWVQVRNEKYHLQQFCDTRAGFTGKANTGNIAAITFHEYFVLRKPLCHSLGVRIGLVNFGNRDNVGNLCRLNVGKRLCGLRFDALFAGNHEYRYIRRNRAARANTLKGLMPRGI